MRYIKHLSAALIALGISAPLMAQDTLVIPSQQGGFKVGVDTLYLRKTVDSSFTDSNYDWGFYAHVGYLFPATGNDITIGYTRMRFNDNDSLDMDAIDLEAGQRLTTGAFDVRLIAGVRYKTLGYEFDASNDKTDEVGAINSKFKGVGPMFGANVRYQLGNCFGLDAHMSTALLVGNIKYGYQVPNISGSGDSNGVVPEVNTKFGIDYTMPTSSFGGKSALVVEVGYQADHAFNALSSTIQGFSNTDISLDGPYVDIKYFA